MKTGEKKLHLVLLLQYVPNGIIITVHDTDCWHDEHYFLHELDCRLNSDLLLNTEMSN